MTKSQMKWAGVASLIALSLFLLYPTADWYTMDADQRELLETSRLRPKRLLNLGLDLKGGTQLLMELEVERLAPDADIPDALNRAIEVIRNRVDQLGVAEPLIARQGERWIVVQLPGIKNPRLAKEVIGQTALLEFRLVESSDDARKAIEKIYELGDPFAGGKISTAAAALLPEKTMLFRAREGGYHILRDTAAVTGAHLDSARVETGENGLPVVAFFFKPEGGRLFGNFTAANVGKDMAVVLDGIVQSAPVIQEPIRGGSGIIEGDFTMQEARKLAIVLRAGALPAPLHIIEERTVGATLGADSIRQGLWACLVGGLLVLIFMVAYYRMAGLFADIAMLLNLLFVIGMMAYFGATLTLPGIAGILLTVGMAIDANVLIFERIREELRIGRPVRIAIDAGYDKASSAILDSNVTTLVAAVFLFQFGTGPIKGFAVTLSLGILCSMFTAIVVTRLMFESYLSAGPVDELSIGKAVIPAFKERLAIDFIGKRTLYFLISGLLMVASVMFLSIRGLNFGIDFTGGSVVRITYEKSVEPAELRAILRAANYSDAILQRFTGTNSYAIRIKTRGRLSADTAENFIMALRKSDPGRSFIVDQQDFVGPTVGRHLYKQAVFAILFSLLGIVGYVAFRFSNPLWGMAGVIALGHDVLAALGLFAALQMEVNLVLVAAVLTIAGYSINDSIVVFDRMRENMRKMRREPFFAVANASINETMSRTLITSLTMLLTVVTLQFLGGTVIHDFAVALTFGVIVGTYSSIAIAVPLVYQVETRRSGRDG